MNYDTSRFLGAETYTVQSGQNFSFPTHLHPYYEIILITDGEMEITINDKVSVLHKNQAGFVFPNITHSLKTNENSKYKSCIFSNKLVSYFNRKHFDKMPDNPFFDLDNFSAELFENLQKDSETCHIKGVLYLICSIFDKKATYSNISEKFTKSLLGKILLYIENNFKSNCSLKSIAKEISYDYSYLSKYFISLTKISLNKYINLRRVNEACYLLSTTNMTIIDICSHVGYDSLRTLNRNFKSILKITPLEYRQELKSTL